MNNSLIEDFGCLKPKIAVLGLNPHAGDNGVFGDEEPREIIPAIDAAREENSGFWTISSRRFFWIFDFQKFDGYWLCIMTRD